MDASVDDAGPLSFRETAATHLRALGYDPGPTHADAGEGLDLRGSDVVAVVGEPDLPVGLAELQRLAGIAAVERLRAAAMAVAVTGAAEPYAEDAADWADRAG